MIVAPAVVFRERPPICTSFLEDAGQPRILRLKYGRRGEALFADGGGRCPQQLRVLPNLRSQIDQRDNNRDPANELAPGGQGVDVEHVSPPGESRYRSFDPHWPTLRPTDLSPRPCTLGLSPVRRKFTADRTARSRDWLQIMSTVAIIISLGLVIYELNQSKQLVVAQAAQDYADRQRINNAHSSATIPDGPWPGPNSIPPS
jgi:hypothetical protein